MCRIGGVTAVFDIGFWENGRGGDQTRNASCHRRGMDGIAGARGGDRLPVVSLPVDFRPCRTVVVGGGISFRHFFRTSVEITRRKNEVALSLSSNVPFFVPA